MGLKPYYHKELVEAGCDEAGRGCLAGPVYAAAVILPKDFEDDLLKDSKRLELEERLELRERINETALAWSVASVNNEGIDEINILNASIKAMHKALDRLDRTPELILVDGNRFHPYENIEHRCCVKGDNEFFPIAAASILAKTYRDEYMEELHEEYPVYQWKSNKGYPTPPHRKAINKHGVSPYHRRSFNLNFQQDLDL